MFFWKKDRIMIENLSKQLKILSNQVEMYEGARNTREIKSKENVDGNLDRVNSMILELKGVVSSARAALSERKAFDEFLELASKKIIDMIEAGEKKNSKKIDKDLSECKQMISGLTKAYEDSRNEPYAKITHIMNTLERIEQLMEKEKALKKSSVKLPKSFGKTIC